ncbi:MAG: F0F1 ATP synthase subunit delta [Gammaproteobacteria bacterium]|nr:F0F1 ATP synthase subunit delta [Gammaproteobacteria bacterium]
MAEKSTVARPYALAAFELAKEKNELAKWSEMLQFTALVASDETMQQYIGNPHVSRESLGKLFFSICEGQLTDLGKNFIKVLIDNRRLDILPQIAMLYEYHRAEAERTIDAEVISAFPLSDAQQNLLADKLKQRLGRSVNLIAKVDPNLLGGAIVRAGDLVIDGSVNGQVDKLAQALMH